MTTEVSSMVKRNGGTANSEILITMDLLGGLSNKLGKKDLDLDLQNIPKAWEISLDLKRCKSPNSQIPSSSSSSSSSDKRKQKHELVEKEEEEKESSNSKTPPWKFMEESSLELKLNVDYSFSHCQSVCTLDKVKSALQRAEKETLIKKRLSNDDDDDEKKSFSSNNGGILFAAACPGCLMYVMTLKKKPICPRCNATVPSPISFKNKKPRIDLNATF